MRKEAEFASGVTVCGQEDVVVEVAKLATAEAEGSAGLCVARHSVP